MPDKLTHQNGLPDLSQLSWPGRSTGAAAVRRARRAVIRVCLTIASWIEVCAAEAHALPTEAAGRGRWWRRPCSLVYALVWRHTASLGAVPPRSWRQTYTCGLPCRGVLPTLKLAKVGASVLGYTVNRSVPPTTIVWVAFYSVLPSRAIARKRLRGQYVILDPAAQAVQSSDNVSQIV